MERVRRKGTWSVGDRMEFFVGLCEDIHNFIHDLLPHMEEEEQVRGRGFRERGGDQGRLWGRGMRERWRGRDVSKWGKRAGRLWV